jgi:hypothetical protein
MVNVLGHRDPGRAGLEGYAEALAVPGVSVHLYGKPSVPAPPEDGARDRHRHRARRRRGRAEHAAALLVV